MRRLGTNEHIVQARRSAVTPAKARPEKYHGVVRELYVARVFTLNACGFPLLINSLDFHYCRY